MATVVDDVDLEISIQHRLDMEQIICDNKTRCIYRVPRWLKGNVRDDKDAMAYTPEIVSFGPYHRGAARLAEMEKHKWRCLKTMLSHKRQDVTVYIHKMREIVDDVRACYERPLGKNEIHSNNSVEMTKGKLQDDSEEKGKGKLEGDFLEKRKGKLKDPSERALEDKFVEMLVLDGCFMLEFLLVNQSPLQFLGYEDDDPVFSKKTIMEVIRRDMVKLENQLPIMVLEKLLAIRHSGLPSGNYLLDQVLVALSPIWITNEVLTTKRISYMREADAAYLNNKMLHCLDIFRSNLLYKPPLTSQEQPKVNEVDDNAGAGEMRTMIGATEPPAYQLYETEPPPPLYQLYEAGPPAPPPPYQPYETRPPPPPYQLYEAEPPLPPPPPPYQSYETGAPPPPYQLYETKPPLPPYHDLRDGPSGKWDDDAGVGEMRTSTSQVQPVVDYVRNQDLKAQHDRQRSHLSVEVPRFVAAEDMQDMANISEYKPVFDMENYKLVWVKCQTSVLDGSGPTIAGVEDMRNIARISVAAVWDTRNTASISEIQLGVDLEPYQDLEVHNDNQRSHPPVEVPRFVAAEDIQDMANLSEYEPAIDMENYKLGWVKRQPSVLDGSGATTAGVEDMRNIARIIVVVVGDTRNTASISETQLGVDHEPNKDLEVQNDNHRSHPSVEVPRFIAAEDKQDMANISEYEPAIDMENYKLGWVKRQPSVLDGSGPTIAGLEDTSNSVNIRMQSMGSGSNNAGIHDSGQKIGSNIHKVVSYLAEEINKVRNREPRPAWQKPRYEKVRTNCVEDLREAGVKFKIRDTQPFLDISFDKRRGLLGIPPIKINDASKTVFLNLIAYEQCHYTEFKKMEITDYVAFMDTLVNSGADVDRLHKKGIIVHQLGSDAEVADLFNSLVRRAYVASEQGRLSGLYEQLNKYCAQMRHRWYANLRHDYLKNPWVITSIIAALILFVLTGVQTYFTVWPRK